MIDENLRIKFLIAFLGSVCSLIPLFIGKRLNRITSLHKHYIYIKEIYNDFYSRKYSIAKLGMEKYLKINLSFDEFKSIMVSRDLSIYIRNLKRARSKLKYNSSKGLYQLKTNSQLQLILSTVVYIVCFAPVLFYFFDIVNFLRLGLGKFITASYFATVFLYLSILSSNNIRSLRAAEIIIRSEEV